MYRADAKITSIKNKLLYHRQRSRAEESAATYSITTVSVPILSGTAPMPTLSDLPFSDTPEYPTISLSTLPSDNLVEEPILVTDYAPSDFPTSVELSSLSSTIPTNIPTE